jgi:hypothetical protein
MGDFNINLVADSPEKRELLDILDIFFHLNGSHGLYAPPPPASPAY